MLFSPPDLRQRFALRGREIACGEELVLDLRRRLALTGFFAISDRLG
jgi:hypothetical protein